MIKLDGELVDDEEQADFTVDEIENYGRATVFLNYLREDQKRIINESVSVGFIYIKIKR